ncbi:hypothetical protein B0J11DRAFT_72674 [Dendryphion nanum]|uniref:Apple domain-containing protein n=1 Tax=Dendryphion nanum TaxID=256645 RepID=A0A9P9DIS5_9PLEO|nr:hypothetical protein B0J11DRAFT_72674 [Dendryphion nanum]
MKATIVVAAALAASASGAVIEARQRTRQPEYPTVPDGIASPIRARAPQWISIGPPQASVTFFPNDPVDRVSQCGLDAFIGHTSEALLFCSSILKGGTATLTQTYTSRETTTTKTTIYTTLYPPSKSSTVRPPTSTPKPSSSVRPPTSSPPPKPSSTSTPPPKPSSTSTPRPPSSSSVRPSSSSVRPSTVITSSPTPTPTAGCGIVGYVKTTAAYFFDSSGTKNNWSACSAACKADTKCKSFGYGEANCMLFDVAAADNTNYNPMSPYTFYDSTCPVELPVRKRQVNISLGIPGGAGGISSACSCLITSGPGGTTKTTTVTVTSVRVTRTETITRTVSLLPEDLVV